MRGQKLTLNSCGPRRYPITDGKVDCGDAIYKETSEFEGMRLRVKKFGRAYIFDSSDFSSDIVLHDIFECVCDVLMNEIWSVVREELPSTALPSRGGAFSGLSPTRIGIITPRCLVEKIENEVAGKRFIYHWVNG